MTTMVRDWAICGWFVLAGLAFWGPYLGWGLPDMTPLYGLFLLVAVAALALRLLSRQDRGAAPVAVVVPDAPAVPAARQRAAQWDRPGRTNARRGRGAGG